MTYGNSQNTNIIDPKIQNKIIIDKYTYFDILFPEEQQIPENILNNNGIVAKLNYYNFSMLFTADIEEIAEKKILQKYNLSVSSKQNNGVGVGVPDDPTLKNMPSLQSTILKIAHDGMSYTHK